MYGEMLKIQVKNAVDPGSSPLMRLYGLYSVEPRLYGFGVCRWGLGGSL